MARAEVTVTMSGPIFRGAKNMFRQPMINAAERIAQVVEDAAIEDYAKKRKSIDPTSFIIDSFYFETPVKTKTEVKSIVFAGGPPAPYTVFVDEGHRLRDGTDWAGYHFMAEGTKEGDKQAVSITNEEIAKVVR